MVVEYQIRKVELRAARKSYECQCKTDGCQEKISVNEQYANFKIVEKHFGEYKNQEKKVSQKCQWFLKWKEFLNIC